jgi:hypothetical protein
MLAAQSRIDFEAVDKMASPNFFEDALCHAPSFAAALFHADLARD